MIATTEEQRLLEKWQKKLCLQEWRIKLVTHLRPEEMSVSNAAGCTDWSESIKTARIEIINPACYGDRIVPFDFEKTLVHATLCVKDEDKSYEGQSVGETLRMLPLELADREIDKSWWFFNTFVITLK